MIQDNAVLAEAACALLTFHVAPRARPAAAGALQTPLTVVLQADADLAARLADFLSRRDAGAAGFRAISAVMGKVHGDIVGRDQRIQTHTRP